MGRSVGVKRILLPSAEILLKKSGIDPKNPFFLKRKIDQLSESGVENLFFSSLYIKKRSDNRMTDPKIRSL